MIRLALVNALSALIQIMSTLILVRCLLSWLPIDPYSEGFFSKVVRVIYSLTEPLLAPIRALLMKTPLANMPLDFSPIGAFIALELIQSLIFMLLL